jgi:protein involved in polysaccharide export with SLBB domain
MRTLLTMKLKQWCGIAGFFAVSLHFTGCGHLAYTDPNPSTPYAFPGQPAPAPTQAWTPTTGQYPPVLPGALPPNPGNPVNVSPNAMIPPPPAGSDGYRGTGVLTVGETVTISWSDLPPDRPWMDGKQRIGEDGKIILPFNVSVVAAGKTANQLADDIRKEYVPKYFVRLTATVKTEERFYFVGGEVKIPNRQMYLGDMTVLRAIDTAGGFTDFADRKNIELRRANGQKVKVNSKKVAQDPKLDPPVYANDQIIVHKRGPF